MTDEGPSCDDVWDYFSTEMIPIIANWQVESTAKFNVGSAVASVNDWLTDFLDQLEAKDCSLSQVIQIVSSTVLIMTY